MCDFLFSWRRDVGRSRLVWRLSDRPFWCRTASYVGDQWGHGTGRARPSEPSYSLDLGWAPSVVTFTPQGISEEGWEMRKASFANLCDGDWNAIATSVSCMTLFMSLTVLQPINFTLSRKNLLKREIFYFKNVRYLNLFLSFLAGQWENEINRRCKRNTLSVVLFHGQDRNKLASKLHQYDVVITTYQVKIRYYKHLIGKSLIQNTLVFKDCVTRNIQRFGWQEWRLSTHRRFWHRDAGQRAASVGFTANRFQSYYTRWSSRDPQSQVGGVSGCLSTSCRPPLGRNGHSSAEQGAGHVLFATVPARVTVWSVAGNLLS